VLLTALYRTVLLSVVLAPGALAQAAGQRKLEIDDLYNLRTVSDPQLEISVGGEPLKLSLGKKKHGLLVG